MSYFNEVFYLCEVVSIHEIQSREVNDRHLTFKILSKKASMGRRGVVMIVRVMDCSYEHAFSIDQALLDRACKSLYNSF